MADSVEKNRTRLIPTLDYSFHENSENIGILEEYCTDDPVKRLSPVILNCDDNYGGDWLNNKVYATSNDAFKETIEKISIDGSSYDKVKAKQFIDDQINRKTQESIEFIKRKYLKDLVSSGPTAKPTAAVNKTAIGLKNVNKSRIPKAESTKRLPKNPLHELRRVQAKVRRSSVKPVANKTATPVLPKPTQQLKYIPIKKPNTRPNAPFKEISCNAGVDPTTKIVINIRKGEGSVKKTFALKEFIEIVQRHVLVCPALASALSKNAR